MNRMFWFNDGIDEIDASEMGEIDDTAGKDCCARMVLKLLVSLF